MCDPYINYGIKIKFWLIEFEKGWIGKGSELEMSPSRYIC